MDSRKFRSIQLICAWLCALLVGACTVPEPRETSDGHLGATIRPSAAIPEPVRRVALLPPPEPAPELETYTVVVNEVPVKELLFALARDAVINVDIDPQIEGVITLNAVDQTLLRILERISRRVNVRYEFDDETLVISTDRPFLRTYKVDYVNLVRDSKSTVSIATQVFQADVGEVGDSSGVGGSDTNSTTDIESISQNRFWETLTRAIEGIIAEQSTSGRGREGANRPYVIPQPESGVVLVRASARQHDEVQAFLDKVLVSVRYQVLIEATVVEVKLNDNYQTGIDWTLMTGDWDIQQRLGNVELGDLAAPSIAIGITPGELSATVNLLTRFGDVSVVSSPKIMALNNQAAVLKVVENIVYFEIESDTTQTSDAPTLTTFDTTARTVPVGFIMTITPQISASDTVTLDIRPTISRVTDFVQDPNPQLVVNGQQIDNLVPQIATREIASVLKLNSGQTAVLGGLMQDEILKDTQGIPVLSDIPALGELFTRRNNDFTKSELVIFVRPTVIKTPSLERDFRDFRQFLPGNLSDVQALPTLRRGLVR